MLSPTEIISKIEEFKCTEPKFLTGKEFAMVRFRLGNKPMKVKMTGDLVRPLERSESEYGLHYQLCVRFDEEECEYLDHILEMMSDEIKGEQEFDAKQAHREGLMFIKVPTDPKHTRFKCDINIPLTPIKLKHDLNEADEEVTIEMALSGWFRKADDGNKYGIRTKVTKLHFGPVNTKTKKKRKQEEEEVLEVHSPSPLPEAPGAPKKKKTKDFV